MKNSFEALERSKKMVDVLSRAAAVFLSNRTETFEDMMTAGMGMIAEMADIDRLNLWRNYSMPDGLHASQIYRWDRESGGTTEPIPELTSMSFDKIAPSWEKTLRSGESINSPSRLLNEKQLLASYGVVSVFITPIFIKEDFWGIVIFSDHRNERYFDDDCAEMMRSAAFLCANAVMRQEMEREIIKANRFSHAIIESMPVGMAIFKGNPPKIVDCNNKLAEMFETTKQQIVIDYDVFSPKYLPNGRLASEHIRYNMNRTIAGETVNEEAPHQTADGRPVPCDLTLTRVKDEDEFIGLGFLYDMTKIRKHEQELFNTQKTNALQLVKLNLAFKAAKIGLWDMEIIRDDPVNNKNIISWSNEFRAMLGFNDESDFPNVISSFHNCLHPDDAERVPNAIAAHMMDTTGKTPYNIEYRVIKKNGETAYIRATGETVRDNEGNPLRVAGTIMDITEEKNILNNMEKLRMEAEEANKAKSAFLANMSHEIRTPLNAVIGLSDLILNSDEGLNEESRYRLEQINNAGATLLSTVNDILDISKIEAGKFELVPVKYDIPSMINDAVVQSILHRGEKPIEFVMDICENLPTHLFGDELRIKQILNNLLSNAFKYTLAGTVALTVNCVREGEDVLLNFIIKDTGVGIKQEDMTNLFNDYVQVDMGANRKVIGTGLGLSIANRLANLMDGNIAVESEYGKGSVFNVRLMQKHVTDDIIGPEVIKNLKNLSYSETSRQRLGALARISLPYARVLIVDDVVTNLDVAKGLMKPYNMQIDCVTSGWEAVEAMSNESIRYNAIFMDHMMPQMDGVEATKLIREMGTDYAENIPIIALTANAIMGNEEMFLSKGFQAFISKPIEISRLDAVIREWVRDKEQEKLYGREESSASLQQNNANRRVIEKIVPGLDIEKGIKRFSGDIDAYLEVLLSYVKNTPPLLISSQEAGKNRDCLADYETIVHGIKGSSRAIFAGEIADMAEALEGAANSGKYDYIDANNSIFIETALKLITDIEKMLEEIDVGNLKPKKEKPDNELLERLREACISYEMNKVDAVMAELETFDYESDGELVIWLRENVEQTNFDDIAVRLSVLNE